MGGAMSDPRNQGWLIWSGGCLVAFVVSIILAVAFLSVVSLRGPAQGAIAGAAAPLLIAIIAYRRRQTEFGMGLFFGACVMVCLAGMCGGMAGGG
jgi:hypothetical protein